MHHVKPGFENSASRLCLKVDCIGYDDCHPHVYSIGGVLPKQEYFGNIACPTKRQDVAKEHYDIANDPSAFGAHARENGLKYDHRTWGRQRIEGAKPSVAGSKLFETVTQLSSVVVKGVDPEVEIINTWLETKRKKSHR